MVAPLFKLPRYPPLIVAGAWGLELKPEYDAFFGADDELFENELR